MKHLRRHLLAAAYTALAAALAYLIWFHFDPDGILTWVLAALWLLAFNLSLLSYRLARRSLWRNTYAHPSPLPGGSWRGVGRGFTRTLASTATFLWHGELPPTSPLTPLKGGIERGRMGGEVIHPALTTFENYFWRVPFENGRQVIVNKQAMLDWLYDCWFRQEYYRQTRKKLSAISQDLGDKELGRYQWQARIWLLDMVKAVERNTTDRRSLPRLRYLPYKIIEMLEASYPSESK